MSADASLSGRLAGRIRSLAPLIVQTFMAELRRQDSPLLHTEHSRSRCRSHAREVVCHIADELARPRLVDRAREFGNRATAHGHGAHLQIGDVWLAAIAMFTALVETIVEEAPLAAIGMDGLALVTVVGHRVISVEVGPIAYGYMRSILCRIHQEHVDERRRLSRELHDQIGNATSTAFRNVELTELYLTSEPERARTHLDRAKHALVETLGQVRRINSELRSEHPANLRREIGQYVQDACPAHTEARVRVRGEQHPVPPIVRDEVFLIVREALRNAFAHARAAAVRASVDIGPTEVRAAVHDDGVGFEPAAVGETSSGLCSMRERAELLGGSLAIDTAPGQGTRIDLVIPSCPNAGYEARAPQGAGIGTEFGD